MVNLRGKTEGGPARGRHRKKYLDNAIACMQEQFTEARERSNCHRRQRHP